MSDVKDFNQGIIEQFRANGGVVGPPFEGVPMLLLHTVGAKSGQERISPLAYRPVGDTYAIFGSFAGAPKDPAWVHNLRANPDVTIEVGTETKSVRARFAEGAERDEIWEAQKRDAPTFAEYEARTDRIIPVILLEAQ